MRYLSISSSLRCLTFFIDPVLMLRSSQHPIHAGSNSSPQRYPMRRSYQFGISMQPVSVCSPYQYAARINMQSKTRRRSEETSAERCDRHVPPHQSCVFRLRSFVFFGLRSLVDAPSIPPFRRDVVHRQYSPVILLEPCITSLTNGNRCGVAQRDLPTRSSGAELIRTKRLGVSANGVLGFVFFAYMYMALGPEIESTRLVFFFLFLQPLLMNFSP